MLPAAVIKLMFKQTNFCIQIHYYLQYSWHHQLLNILQIHYKNQFLMLQDQSSHRQLQI